MQGATSARAAPLTDGTRPRSAALVVAHPGHELRLFGWLSLARPTVHVLTDGSGASGASRLASTTRVLAAAGATPGSVYGTMTDGDLYAAVLAGQVEPFLKVVDALARSLEETRAEVVVADAVEGYNPAHDLASVVVAAAVARAGRRGVGVPALFEYAVVGEPAAAGDAVREGGIRVDLDAAALRRKTQAALAYGELKAEVADALSGAEAARADTEWIRRLDPAREPGVPAEDPPFYERHGARRVREGRYERVLTFRGHMRPFARALLDRARQSR